MNKAYLFLLLIIPFLYFLQEEKSPVARDLELKRYEFESQHMGTLFRITLYAEDDSLAGLASDSAFQHIEKLNSILSDYDPNSELNRFAGQSGNGNYVKISSPLFEVLNKALLVSRQTDGAFDITVGPYVELWRKMRSADEPRLPDEDKLKQLNNLVGYFKIQIDSTRQSAALLKKNMRLDLGGIAKGYAADEALRVLGEFNIYSALIDAGGDIVLGDTPPEKDGWHVSIPVRHEGEAENTYIILLLSNKALATSGDLFQYVEIGDKRYSHIVNPKTGIGLTDRSTVSVVAPDGISADSYASAVSVLGPQEGLRFIESKPGTEVRIEYVENDSVYVQQTDGFQRFNH